MNATFTIGTAVLLVLIWVVIWISGHLPGSSHLPIKHDDPMYCQNCGMEHIIHNRTLYNEYDEETGRKIGVTEYRRCTRCGMRSTYKYDLDGNVVSEFKKEDRTKTDYDFKRKDPRTYKKRGG
jgi:hypothetical protein